MDFVLKNNELTVGFCSQGGSLCSIRDKEGTEYLWQGDTAYWSGQAPVLFPICGSLRNNQAQIGNSQVTQMPRHGIVRKRNFVCHKQDKGEIVFRIESDKEMEKQFPYPFRLDIRYILGLIVLCLQGKIMRIISWSFPRKKLARFLRR